MDSVLERFKKISKDGKISNQSLDAQTKYDVLAAIRSMEQLEAVMKSFETRAKKRDPLRKKLLANAQAALGRLADLEEIDLSDIDDALQVLNTCRTEMIRMRTEETVENAFKKLIPDGISAGR